MHSTQRRFELLSLLRSPEGKTLRDLAARLGVSKNTVQRDLDYLSSVTALREQNEGQTLRFHLDDGRPEFTSAREPSVLEGLQPWRRARWFAQARSVIDAPLPEAISSGGERMFEQVVLGLLEHREVRLTYRARSATTRSRTTIRPARLRFAAGLAYLDGHVVPDGEFRTFAVHRIVEARATQRTFTPQKLAPRTAFGAVEAEPVEVEVWFAAEVAEYICERRWHPSQRIEEQPDGSSIWRGKVSGENEFLGWVLAWSPWTELLSPPRWREMVRARSQHTLRLHLNNECPNRSCRDDSSVPSQTQLTKTQ